MRALMYALPITNNYGTLLQNFALQCVMKKWGWIHVQRMFAG